ncbi:MAG: hypothetical protein J2P48_04330 [Alphaproteobacteria bacterium]|nr:hypothetical protein [Alphaproteobacteria bacterium]
MSAWIPATLAIAVATVLSAAGAGAGPCPRDYLHNCVKTPFVINLSSLPTISEQIANEKPSGQKQQNTTVDPPAPAPYTGPTFGTSLGRGAPTVGYKWLLE